MPKLKNVLKNLDLLKLLIILVVVVIVVRIFLSVQNSNINKKNNSPVQNSANSANINKPIVQPNEVGTSSDLLSHLPYTGPYFKVGYLPLEKDTPAKIIVDFLVPGTDQQFKKWLDQYKYSPDTVFIYNEAGTVEPNK